jgi:hypothetical protein
MIQASVTLYLNPSMVPELLVCHVMCVTYISNESLVSRAPRTATVAVAFAEPVELWSGTDVSGCCRCARIPPLQRHRILVTRMCNQWNHLHRILPQIRTKVHIMIAPRMCKPDERAKHNRLQIEPHWLVVTRSPGAVIAIWIGHVLHRGKIVARSEVVVVTEQIVSISVGDEILLHSKADCLVVVQELGKIV